MIRFVVLTGCLLIQEDFTVTDVFFEMLCRVKKDRNTILELVSDGTYEKSDED